MDGVLSTYQSVDYGVPQGSVLGPILFSIYINSIDRPIKYSKIKLYSDYTNLYGENPEYVQHDLDLVATWCDDNMLTLNSNKSPSITFLPSVKRNETIPVFKIRGEPINSVVKFKYLGLILDTNLNFQAHYSDLINSVQYKIHFLSKIRKFLTIKTALLLYKTTILPLIDYGDFIYDQDVHYFNNKLQVLQNRALRIIYKSPIIVGQ